LESFASAQAGLAGCSGVPVCVALGSALARLLSDQLFGMISTAPRLKATLTGRPTRPSKATNSGGVRAWGPRRRWARNRLERIDFEVRI